MKQQIKSTEENLNMSRLNPVIQITHFDNDKHVKTDVYPITHFLDQKSLWWRLGLRGVQGPNLQEPKFSIGNKHTL